MTRESRRQVLKGLGLVLPVAWNRPVIETVVLPVHAQTSSPGCSAPVGCYNYAMGSFTWPGGTGPLTALSFYLGVDDCQGESGLQGTVVLVVAANQSEAEEAVGGGTVQELPTDPAPSPGCSFFAQL